MNLRFCIVVVILGATSGAADLRAQCAPRTELEAQLKRAPNDDAAMECLGRVLIEQGASGDAVDWLEKAVKVNGKSASHHMWLGHALREETQKAGSLRQPFLARRMKTEYEQAVALDPTLVDARHWLVMFLMNAPAMMGGSVEKAREHANAIVPLDSARGHVDLAQIAEHEKDYAGAIAIYEQLLKVKPDYVNAHLSIGRVSIRSLKDYDRGENEVRFWLDHQPKDAAAVNIANAHYLLGVVHEQRGRRDQAKAEYQAAVAANPKHEDAKKALGAVK
jgi:tetratricopeptide (TPR) repeat protein